MSSEFGVISFLNLQCYRKNAIPDPVGTLEKALERNLLNVQHDSPLPLLAFSLGEASVTHSIP